MSAETDYLGDILAELRAQTAMLGTILAYMRENAKYGVSSNHPLTAEQAREFESIEAET